MLGNHLAQDLEFPEQSHLSICNLRIGNLHMPNCLNFGDNKLPLVFFSVGQALFWWSRKADASSG
jgi:hypothetical protein